MLTSESEGESEKARSESRFLLFFELEETRVVLSLISLDRAQGHRAPYGRAALQRDVLGVV